MPWLPFGLPVLILPKLAPVFAQVQPLAAFVIEVVWSVMGARPAVNSVVIIEGSKINQVGRKGISNSENA
jgi:hypothetical protein